jgi:hypothetical protein
VGRIGIPYVPDDTCIDANYVQNMHLLNWYHFGLMGKLRHLCRYLNDRAICLMAYSSHLVIALTKMGSTAIKSLSINININT